MPWSAHEISNPKYAVDAPRSLVRYFCSTIVSNSYKRVVVRSITSESSLLLSSLVIPVVFSFVYMQCSTSVVMNCGV